MFNTLWPWLILVTIYGACIGSFLNVVIYRLPREQSLTTPGSRCPGCGKPIAWYDNLPILSWLILRARCRHCQTPISVAYPLVEAVTALLFATLFAIYYFIPQLATDFYDAGFFASWPALIVHLTLLAALVAATVIDAKLFIIPLRIPWFALTVAVIVLPLAVALNWQTHITGIIHTAIGWQFALGVGGVVGLAVAFALLHWRIIPQSFQELHDQIADPEPPDEFLNHPHPRREVLKELLFVAFPLAGAAIGALAVHFNLLNAQTLPPWAATLGGILVGFLVGGALVWATRILGTLAFGKEAMGLGDVHLLAAIGAVLGPVDAVLVFFLAPFFGLVAAVALAGLAALIKGQVRMIPYGPYLAAATLLVMIAREPIIRGLGY